MHDRVRSVRPKYAGDRTTVANVYVFKRVSARFADRRERVEVSGIGELVDVDYVRVGMVYQISDHRRADEPSTTCNYDGHGHGSGTNLGGASGVTGLAATSSIGSRVVADRRHATLHRYALQEFARIQIVGAAAPSGRRPPPASRWRPMASGDLVEELLLAPAQRGVRQPAKRRPEIFVDVLEAAMRRNAGD